MKVILLLCLSFIFIRLANAENSPWTDDSCDFQKIDLKMSPKSLVEEYLRLDFAGQFLNNNKWMDQAITCPGHAPGPDSSTVVSKYQIVSFTGNSIKVSYDVIGHLDAEKFKTEMTTQTVSIKVIQTPFGYKIDDSFIGGDQHISIDAAIRLATGNKLAPKYLKVLKALKK